MSSVAHDARPRLASLKWPPPPPGRVKWAWLLGLRVRRWRIRSLLRLGIPLLRPRPVVLDVGSGPGFDAEELEALLPQPAAQVVLLDPQRQMLLKVYGPGPNRRPHRPTCERVVGDAAQLAIRESSVDLLLSLGVLCCVAEASVEAAVRESFRVLRPGGWAVLAVPRRRGSVDEARFRNAGFLAGPRKRSGLAWFEKRL